MDRFVCACLLALLAWCYAGVPCVAQSAAAPAAASAADARELLPVLKPLKDPLERAPLTRPASRAVAPVQPPAPAVESSEDVSVSRSPLCASMLSPVRKWPAPDLTASPGSGQLCPPPDISAAKPLIRTWASLSLAPSPTADPALTRTSQTIKPFIPLPRTPEALSLKFKKAPLESTDVALPINLATALRLSDARPLIVAAAQASVWAAEAQLTRAKLLWVPGFVFGFDYIRHDGGGPDINKGVMTVNSTNFFYGGAGLWGNVNLSDIIFQPLVQRQTLNARQHDIQTAKNDALMQTADAYFMVHQYRGTYAGYLYTVERGHDLIERIEQLSKDLVPKVEVDRARNFVADLEQSATSAREAWRINSAYLTQVLRLDPRTVVVPMEHDHLQITLIDPDQSLKDLMRTAVMNRPEIAAQRALVLAAEAKVSREKYRPILPSIMLNGLQSAGMYYQAGIFGLGPNSSLNQWFGRDDVSIQLIWQFDAFGIGNLARIKNQRGEESRAIVDLFRMQDQVAGDVNRALAHLQSATARVSQADRALRTAIITFNGNFEGLKQTTRFEDVLVLVYRPQEAVYALDLLRLAVAEYFGTVADYNRAQFELYHAMGYPAAEIANRRPPGQIEPVNTSRPEYLPPVGNGPPPASR